MIAETDQRIKLAEFVGWTSGHKLESFDHEFWLSADGHGYSVTLDFDPRNDANDCEALIRKLNDEGHQVRLSLNFPSIGHFVKLNHIAAGCVGEWQGDDWKHGVCDLAEKVILL